MNVSPVFFLCLLLLTMTTESAAKGIIDMIWKTFLHFIQSRSSSSVGTFDPKFMDFGNKDQKKGSPGDCGVVAVSTECDPSSPYRTYDGTCNNLAHPAWGRSSDCYLRFLEASYEGKSGLRRSVRGGRPLPLPRDLSLGIFLDRKYPTRDTNFLFTVFGQMVVHDITNALSLSDSESCCSPPLSRNSTHCAPIKVRPDDPFYSQFNVTCLNFTRSAPCCNNGKWQQSNNVTATVDGSIIYGSTKDRALSLRTFDGTGRLKSEPTVHGELLRRPGEREPLPQFCPRDRKRQCFYSGDGRTNQHATLMSIQTVFLREHNRIADALGELNPHWNDEMLYQETRRIVGAQLQNIVYSEYLPALLGPEHMFHYNLSVQQVDSNESKEARVKKNHRTDRAGTTYDPDIRLGIWNEFSTAVFRLHSMVPTKVGLGHYRFRDFYSNPRLLREGKMDSILNGASKVPSQKNDHWFTKDVSDYLLKQPGASHGDDLVSFDIQRGRDHGMPTYVHMLRFLSNRKMDVTEYKDLSPIMSDSHIQLLKKHYADVRDVDLYSGVLMEHSVKSSNFGPTACAIVARQFNELKFGDRFYFEHEGEASSFTADQRESLRRSSLARILCDNTDIRSIQRNSLLLVSAENPLLPCDQIPKVDLALWETDQFR